MKVTTSFARLASDRRGVTAVEYALLAAMVAGAIGVLGTDFTNHLHTAFKEIFS